jgi:acetamidase/formamidase
MYCPTRRPCACYLSRDDAYALISTACDVDITQLVDTNDGVHVICPKALFTGHKSAPKQ